MAQISPHFGLKSFFLAVAVVAGASAIFLHTPHSRRIIRLRTAIEDGDPARVAAELDGLFDANPELRAAQPALHYACQLGNVEVARTLFERGANVNSRDRFRQTPLHVAADFGQLQVAQYLLDIGANPDARDYLDRSPGRLATIAGHYRIAKTICRRQGEVAAERDLAAGKLELKVAGLLADPDHFRRCAKYLEDNFAIGVEHVGCFSSDDHFMDGYHARMEGAIMRRFGRTSQGIYEEAAFAALNVTCN